MWTGLRMERKSYEIPLFWRVWGHVLQVLFFGRVLSAVFGWNVLVYGTPLFLPSNVWTYDLEMAASPLSSPLSLLLWLSVLLLSPLI